MKSIAMIIPKESESVEEDESEKRELRHIRRKIRSKSDPLDLPDSKFKMYFRLRKEAFVYLLNEVKDKRPAAGSSLSVPVILKLASTLRFLGEGGYQKDVGNDFLSKILTEMLTVIEENNYAHNG